MADIGQEEQVAVPVVQPLAKVDPRPVQRVDQRSFLQSCLIDRPAWTVIWARCPFDHPVEDLQLAELRLPGRDTLGTQIIHKGMLAGSRTHGQKRTQAFIKEIPFLFEAIEPARWLFLDGLF